ncbi:GNAT family N-acetyltransferase [Paraburkholderia sp. BCC1876]|uniref:GNAT family N-acetyltransferase n=1 Tax=Paraburkholderia sp. BCC1876 TaxID=2676303 RepID=UPI000554B44B|nr:GNAT family N-acetyltransferase [Paraburkholderia sp. BCC1876]
MPFELSQSLFEIEGHRAIELVPADLPAVQTFLESNPGYFLSAEGCPPVATQAEEELASELPEGWAFSRKHAIGFIDSNHALRAFATIVSDLFADGVWHIGLFILATDGHGRGEARLLYQGLEAWLKASGAKWLRLGVIAGNARAERFWERNGFVESRRRHGVAMRHATHTIRVMIKPLGKAGLSEYRTLVSRDCPDAP